MSKRNQHIIMIKMRYIYYVLSHYLKHGLFINHYIYIQERERKMHEFLIYFVNSFLILRNAKSKVIIHELLMVICCYIIIKVAK
jgi:hypothetical protein